MTSYIHCLQTAVDQRRRAGEIKGTDPRSVAKRQILLKMAERNEVLAELRQRRVARHSTASAKDALKKIDADLVNLREELDALGIRLVRK